MKILISSIGTGQKRDGGYKKAKYEYNGKIIETPFIARALSEFINVDKLFLVGTKKSIWDSVYLEFGGDEDISLKIYEEIEDGGISGNSLKLVEKVLNKGSKCFIIDYGIDENELWNNFSKFLEMLEYIDEGDEVYIDITHSFRSLSLMSFVMVNFGEIIKKKNFKISGVFYGMFEYSFENNGITPIIDLKMFYELMEWMRAVENFIEYSNADKIVYLLENKDEKNLFNRISISLEMANLYVLYENVKNISKKLDKLKQNHNPILNLLWPEVISFIKSLNKDKLSDFQLAVAKWFAEHKNYALGYMALSEAVVSKVCEIKKYKIDDKSSRDRAKKEISSIDKSLYFDVYKSVNQIRNDIAHQLGKRKNSILIDAQNLNNYILKTEKIFERLKCK